MEGHAGFAEFHSLRHHRLGDYGKVDGVLAIFGGGLHHAEAGLTGGVAGHIHDGAVVVVVLFCGQDAVSGHDFPIEGSVQTNGPLIGFTGDRSCGVTGGFHTVGPDQQCAGVGGRCEIYVDFAGGGVIREILTPAVGHFVFVAAFIAGKDANLLRQGVALFVD